MAKEKTAKPITLRPALALRKRIDKSNLVGASTNTHCLQIIQKHLDLVDRYGEDIVAGILQAFSQPG